MNQRLTALVDLNMMCLPLCDRLHPDTPAPRFVKQFKLKVAINVEHCNSQ
ncbi:hypothetical protein [Nostoc sp. MS1]|nr:hypothetical protein [Nostoc sp. MS1]